MAPPSRSPPSMRARSRAPTLHALLVLCDFAWSAASHVVFTDSSALRVCSSILRSLPQNPRSSLGCSCSRLKAFGSLGWSAFAELEFCCTELFSGFGKVRKHGLGAFFFVRPLARGRCLKAIALILTHLETWSVRRLILERGRCLASAALVLTHFETWSGRRPTLERGRCLVPTALVLTHSEIWSVRRPILERECRLTAPALVLTHSEIWSIRRPILERERCLTAPALVLKHYGMTWNYCVGSARLLGMAENYLVGSNSS